MINDVIRQAFWEAKKIAEEKAREKRQDQAIKRWIRLVQGLRIRQRLQAQYASGTAEDQRQSEKQNTDRDEKAEGEEMGAPVRSRSVMSLSNDTSFPQEATTSGGGFLVQADDVVQSYSLPKYQHVTLPFEPIFNKKQTQVTVNDDINDDDLEHTMPEYVTYDIQVMDVDPAENGASAAMPTSTASVPMTMQELAEAAAKKQSTKQDPKSLDAVEGSSTTGNAVGNQNMRPLHSQKSSRQSTPSKATKTRRGAAPATKGRGAAKSRTAMDRNRSARKRRQSSEDSGSHGDSESSHGNHESDHDDDDDPPPKKRRRAPARSPAKPAPSPPTRVLRPRRSKTQAQVEAEQAQEEAYRRAAVA